MSGSDQGSPRGTREPGGATGPGGAAGFAQDGGAVGGSVAKLATGITGFDEMTMGGLPRGRATVVVGQAGSAKTVFAAQFLAEGVRRGQPGVFVTLEEPVSDLRANLSTLGHDLVSWEAAGDWAFVDASPQVRLQHSTSTSPGSPPRPQGNSTQPGPEDASPGDAGLGDAGPGDAGPGGARAAGGVGELVQPYYLQTLLAQISHAVDATAADRIVIDSVTAVLALHPDPSTARQLLRALVASLRALGLTIMMTVESATDPARSLDAAGVEDFVADNVVLVHNIREGRVRRRTLEVLKMRGAAHFKTESAFTVVPGRGVVILPTSRSPLSAPTITETTTSGDPGLDVMLGGGLRGASVVLVAGPTGSGKTLLASTFAAAGPAGGARALVLAYEESHEQVMLNATGWGQDFPTWEQNGLLQVSAFYPDAASLDEHLLEIQDLITGLRPARVVLDSLSALARLGTGESYREFTTRLVAFCKQEQVTTMLTLSSIELASAPSPADAHIAALADAIILVGHDRLERTRGRHLSVLKVRGSAHDEQARPFTITGHGLHLTTTTAPDPPDGPPTR